MAAFKGIPTRWFAFDDTDPVEVRTQSLLSALTRGNLVTLVLTLLISALAFDKLTPALLTLGALFVAVLTITRTMLLQRVRHGVRQLGEPGLHRIERTAGACTVAIHGYLGLLVAIGPPLSAERQAALIGVALLAPLAFLRPLGASPWSFLAAAVPLWLAAAIGLALIESGIKPWLVIAFALALALVAEQCWRDLRNRGQQGRSRNRERSLLSQQLSLFSTSQLGIALTIDGRLGRANARFRQWFGEGSGDALLADLASAIGLSRERLERLIARVDKRVQKHDSRTINVLLNGATPRYFGVQVRRFDPTNPARGLLWTINDQTSDWLRRQASERAATRDPLTGALNRRSLHKRLAAMLARDLRRQPFAVLCVDINRFGELNDAKGQGFGDQVLCIVTRRLQRMLREQDVIARTGGNEFVLLLENVDSADRANAIAEKVMETLSAPIVLTSMTCSIAAAVGISMAPLHGRRTDEILGRARASMFAIKRTLVQVQAGRLGRRP